ncbi:MAG: hypothetical protein J6P98_04925 [Clostridia bacterium]|nr:hypothetical protein [Clostridia bacterium]
MFDINGDNEIQKRADKLLTKNCRGGKNALAATFDAVILAVIAGSILYITVRPHFANRTAAVSVTAICLILAGLVCRSLSQEILLRKKTKARRIIKEELAGIKLMLNEEAIIDMLPKNGSIFFIGSCEEFGSDQVLKAYARFGSKAQIVCFGEPDEGAKKTMRLLGMNEAKKPNELLRKSTSDLAFVSEKELDTAIVSLYGSENRMRARELKRIVHERAFKFIALGAGLFALSYVSGYAIWYRAAATVCMGMGSAVMASEAIRRTAK